MVGREDHLGPLGRPLIDRALYLPKSWTDDRERCRAAGIGDEVEFAAAAAGLAPRRFTAIWSAALSPPDGEGPVETAEESPGRYSVRLGDGARNHTRPLSDCFRFDFESTGPTNRKRPAGSAGGPFPVGRAYAGASLINFASTTPSARARIEYLSCPLSFSRSVSFFDPASHRPSRR